MSAAVKEAEPRVAVKVIEVFAVTLAGVIVNVAVLAPAATLTDAGTDATVAFELFR